MYENRKAEVSSSVGTAPTKSLDNKLKERSVAKPASSAHSGCQHGHWRWTPGAYGARDCLMCGATKRVGEDWRIREAV